MLSEAKRGDLQFMADKLFIFLIIKERRCAEFIKKRGTAAAGGEFQCFQRGSI
jgi:hypothetical protein